MSNIICPKCGEVFTVDESGYAAILEQVKHEEFEKQLGEREALFNTQKANEIQILQAQNDADHL